MTELVDEGKVRIDILSNLPLSLIGVFRDLAKEIALLNCCFLRASENLNFVTTDVPVVMYEPFLYRKFPFRGLKNRFVELTFPISKRVCFLATWNPLLSEFVSVKNDVVRQIILRHFFFAKRFVAYPTKSGFVQTVMRRSMGLGIHSPVRNEPSKAGRGIYTIITREFRSDASRDYYFNQLAPIFALPAPSGTS